MKPFVSVIIPVYNVEKYIGNCLESVRKQTFNNIEIIVVIDGSPDHSSKIVYEQAQKDQRIKVIDRENKGVYLSRIDGIKAATGKYIMFVDGDDEIKENMVEVFVKEIISSNADLVRCKWLLNINGNLSKEKIKIKRYDTISKKEFEPYFYDLLYGTIFFHSMCRQLIKKEVLMKVEMCPLDVIYGEDLVFECHLFNQIQSFKIIDEYLYIYTIHQNSITNIQNMEVIRKKILDCIRINQLLYQSVDVFEIKNKQKYRDLTISKLYANIVYQLINLSSTTKKYSAFQAMMNFIEKEIPKELTVQKINLKSYKKTYNWIIWGFIHKKYKITYWLCTISSWFRK